MYKNKSVVVVAKAQIIKGGRGEERGNLEKLMFYYIYNEIYIIGNTFTVIRFAPKLHSTRAHTHIANHTRT
jgi:hypothetical protein